MKIKIAIKECQVLGVKSGEKQGLVVLHDGATLNYVPIASPEDMDRFVKDYKGVQHISNSVIEVTKAQMRLFECSARELTFES